MNEPAQRPDPDALLARVKAEESRARRGKLKIFFGFAPGVGKTYRMLQVARDLVTEQGADVVVGVAETHHRTDTAALMLGLEILPRKKVEYRGRTLEEFDLDAALARKPKYLLLDELAHTNAEGSRHSKRWQDALDLLDAGIDVFTTVNVQHVESLNDVVAQITHVQVRETIPDSLLEQADEIELVDIAPEELLNRLKEGKVYLPDQARRAADHFFRRGNLLALRELALRRMAQHVDEDVLEYREEHGVQTTWPLGERILVCVGPAPNSSRLIRAAARMAAGLRAPWVATYVDTPSLGGLSDADRERLEQHLRLAESLGATVTRLTGRRVSEALLSYARKHNVTRIVIGKPTHSRLRDKLFGSLLDEVVRGSEDVEVHVISGESQPAEAGSRDRAGRPAPLGAYALAILLVAFTTALAASVRQVYPVPDLEVLYLLTVVLAAVRLGRGPSLLTAMASVLAYDFFFVPPFLTFAVSDVRYVLSFALIFGVGIIVSELTTRLRREEKEAVRREARTAALYALSRELAGAESLSKAAAVVARHAADTFSAKAFVLMPEQETLSVATAAPEGAKLDSKEVGVARWCFEHGRLAGLGTDTLPGSRTVCSPLRVSAAPLGVLAMEPASGTPLDSDQRTFLDAFCRQSAFALERIRLFEEARASSLKASAEEMRSSLLSGVSHDLRTPLASITGAATTMRDAAGLSEETRAELLQSVCDEARRLEQLVANLLEMSRFEAGGVTLKRDWVPLEEVIGSALTRLEDRLVDRDVKVELAEGLPLAYLDPVSFQQVFVNLFENSAKYTPEGTPLSVRVRGDDGWFVIAVADRGPGFPPADTERVFDKFYRGAHGTVPGAGLGLAICRAIVAAHGGTISAKNRDGGGAEFVIRLPMQPGAPTLPPAEVNG